jgi:hypothetical protein
MQLYNSTKVHKPRRSSRRKIDVRTYTDGAKSSIDINMLVQDMEIDLLDGGIDHSYFTRTSSEAESRPFRLRESFLHYHRMPLRPRPYVTVKWLWN